MRKLQICEFPDPFLRKISQPVQRVDQELLRFINLLSQFLDRQPGGIGIAAVQVGVLKRIAVVDVSKRIPGSERLILINPVVLEASEPRTSREGCMSLPHYTANVSRADKIRIRFQSLDLAHHEKTVSGLEAVCIQHEVDHMNGLLFVDRVCSLKTDVFKRRRYLQ